MKNRIAILLISFVSLSAYSGGSLNLTGKVTKIENRIAYMITTDGEVQIPVKKLSKEDNQKVNEAIASKKEITLRVSPLVFKK